jgi:hypothetical protein
MNTKLIYLHGFASGALSTKGVFFRDKIKSEFNLDLELPDLNLPSFETLRLTAQIEYVENMLSSNTILIGSSLGGFLAAILAEKYPEKISALILLAPAFEFVSRRKAALGTDFIHEWKRKGSINVDHYYTGKKRALHYGVLEDAAPFEKKNYNISQAILAIHGKNDESVDFELSPKYLGEKSNAEIHLVNDDHGLINTLDFTWSKARPFLANAIQNNT